MKIYVWENNLYLVGTVADVLKTLRNLSKEHKTVQEAIKSYLN